MSTGWAHRVMLLLLLTLSLSRFTFDVPEDTEEIYLTAYYQDSKTSVRAQAETTAYSSYGPEDRVIYIRTNNRKIQVGEYVVFNVKTNFPLDHYDWMIISKNLIINSGREYGGETEKLTSTFR